MAVKQLITLILNVILLASLTGLTNGNVYNIYYSQSQPILAEIPKVILQQGTTGTSTIYMNNTSAKVSVVAPVWLGNWSKRVKLTIDHNDIDENLSNFPILIYLSNSSGRNSADLTFIFNEVGANSKKIAVTTSDGITQCYVEVERWDAANRQAWLWVKIPNINSIVDTELYLYYDNKQPDNTNYVGDPNSTPAEKVWDDNFVFVSHMQDDPDNAHIRDSTQNNNDGTKRAANEPIEENGKTAKAQRFDGTDDYITRAATSSLNLPTAWTLSAWLYLETSPNFYYIITRNTAGTADAQYGYYLRTPQTGGRWGALHNGAIIDVAPSRIWPMQTWVYTVMTWNGSYLQAYYNGARDGDPVARSGTATNQGNWFNIGRRSASADGSSSAGLFGGRIDEVRVSNIARSPAWIKATYESERDNLIAYGNEEAEADYNDALRIVNQIADNWEVDLKIYNSTNINRISNLNINLHNGNSTNQIIIKEGVIKKDGGEPHNLTGNTIIYIGINKLKANATGTSHLHVYLKIKVPNTSTYTLFAITFEIT